MAISDKLRKSDGAGKIDARLFKSLVGSLIYLANTMPNIVQVVSMISRNKELGIKYVKKDQCKPTGYTYNDWAVSLDDRKSTSGYLFCLGTNVVSWISKKQRTIALSSAEAEYVEVTYVACEVIWLRRLLEGFQLVQEGEPPRPISLSKAAAVLARFTAGQTDARPDVAAFVRHASAAFDELVIFHRANRAARKHPELYVSENSRKEVETWKSRKRSREDPQIGKKATRGVGVHGKDANFVEEDGNGFGSHGEKKKQHSGKGFMEERNRLAVKEGKLLHSSDGVESQEDGNGRRKKMKPEVDEVILHRNPTQHSFSGAELLELEDQKDHHKKKRMKKLHC
ncbi:uncharacterized protein LOC121978073 [Zingiber officinale]|uniref:uncharacterized protein LOC121978073 n=1 Tax=Zingiber officinale TaxID=94328 RepID=UPI001C4BF484|nr:uncharacterized protein LOC121978073 [Zingiber officinale]